MAALTDSEAERMEQKVALITGASSGIGKSTAEALAQSGVRVALAARREAELEQLAERIADFRSAPVDTGLGNS